MTNFKDLRPLTEEEAKEAAKNIKGPRAPNPQLPTKDGDYDEWRPPFAPTPDDRS